MVQSLMKLRPTLAVHVTVYPISLRSLKVGTPSSGEAVVRGLPLKNVRCMWMKFSTAGWATHDKSPLIASDIAETEGLPGCI
jgi:hypothetical protein